MHKPLSGLVVGIAFLLTAVRPPAVVSQTPGIGLKSGSVTITRDEYGVPHVFGSTLEAVWFGVGYAQGQDRLWQAELLRRSATGTSAEILGSSAVEGDVLARTLFGPSERRAALFAAASAEMKITLDAFVAGINAWIDEATRTGRLPPEYQAFGISPRPWTVDDTLAEAMLLLRTLGEFGSDELTNAAALQEWTARFGPAEALKVFADTHWSNDPSAPTSVPASGLVNLASRPTITVADVPPVSADAFRQFQIGQADWERNLEGTGLSRGPKSNAIAIAPRLSADGHALLLGGPQMGYSAPQINHEIGIHGAGYDVTGINIAGLPGIPVGVGREHAWSLTAGFSKNNYIYAERLNAQGQYLFNGELRSLNCRPETIVVRGAAPVIRLVCESVHGPVIGTAPGVVFSLKTAVRDFELQGVEAFHSMMRARNYDEFAAALAGAVYNFNVLYADAEGNIAYWHVGRIPRPAPLDNIWLTRDGSGAAEWQGFVAFEDLPHALNPEQGWLTSWNNKPAPGWNNTVTSFLGMHGPVERVNTLTNLLNELAPGSVTLSTLEEINRIAGSTTDTPREEGVGANAPAPAPFNVFVSTVPLLDSMLAHVNAGADDRLPQAMSLLDGWNWLQLDENNDGVYDSPAVVLFNTWWRMMTERIFRDDLGAAFDENIVANMTYRLLVPNPAIPLQHDYVGAGTDVRELVTASLVSALDRLQVRFGSSDPSQWRQNVAQIVWTPLGIGQVPNTIWMNRGTYNQFVHLGKGPQLFGFNVVAPGQSGDPFSPHFSDQLALYATWRSKPMRLDRGDVHAISSITLHADRN
jgi:penicillin G amidase